MLEPNYLRLFLLTPERHAHGLVYLLCKKTAIPGEGRAVHAEGGHDADPVLWLIFGWGWMRWGEVYIIKEGEG